MIVAVTGASGVVGRFVVAELLSRGVRVRAWARPSTDRGGFAGPISWVPGDLGAPAGPLVEGADAVVHAALEHVPGRYRHGEGDDLDRFIEANVGGSLRLMTAARRAGVSRFVFVSSRAVYGDLRDDETLDERDRCLPDTHYGAAKRAVEAFVQSHGLGDRWAACSLRATGVYGVTYPARRSKWLGLARAVLDGAPWPGKRGGTEVHGADLAGAVWALLTSDSVSGQLYNCSDRFVTEREVATIMQRICGARGPLPDEPEAPARRVMRCDRLAALGVRFGGLPRLEQTAAELLALARHEGA